MESSGGSGKDTVADLIRQMTGGETFDDYQVTSLGRGIYDICDNVVDNRNYGRNEEQNIQLKDERNLASGQLHEYEDVSIQTR